MDQVKSFVSGLGEIAGKSFDHKVAGKVVQLDNPITKKEHKKKKALSHRKRKALGLYKIQCQDYAAYQPLNELWKAYINDVLQGAQGDQRIAQLIKADFHGASITVVRSTCPGYVGVQGIIVQETERTFVIVTLKNQLKCLVKAHCVFLMLDVYLYGPQFITRPSDRMSKKFKLKPTIDF